MNNSKLVPALALVLGGLGAALRMWQRSTGYDGAGLPIPGSPAATVLAVFLALCAAGFLLLALRQPKDLADQSAAAPSGAIAAALLALSGCLLAVGGLLSLKSFADDYMALSQALFVSESAQNGALRALLQTRLLPLVLTAASIPAAAGLFYQAKQARSGPEQAPNAFASLMPPFFCWLWLIETYRQHTSNPILWDYVLLLFAVVSILAATYCRAGFVFGAGKPRRSVLFSLLSLFFSAAALPDAGDAATALTLIALALHALVELTALLECCAHQPAPEHTDQITQQEDTPHEQ